MGYSSTEMDDVTRMTEASAWRARLFEAQGDTSEAFEIWLAQDPRNANAWAHVQGVWTMFGDQATAPELLAARRDALERARRGRHAERPQAASWRWGPGQIAASLAALAIVTGGGGLGTWVVTKPDVYQTAIGERRVVALTDGSRIALDSNTLLKVRLRGEARMLDLARGQARFNVAHDVRRPFTVHAGDKTVVATGTSFNVDLLGSQVVVTLIEGRVSVLQDQQRATAKAPTKSSGSVLAKLVAGEQFVAAQRAEPDAVSGVATVTPVHVERVNIDQATSWENGQLIFENEPLSAVVERVNRYSDHRVVVDGSAAAMKISGVFDAGDIATFVDAMQRALPVVAQRDDSGAIHLRPRS